MSTSLLYHAFGIRGYIYTRTAFVGGTIHFAIDQGSQEAGQVRYWQYGEAENSPDLAISDLSRFLSDRSCLNPVALYHLPVPGMPLNRRRHCSMLYQCPLAYYGSSYDGKDSLYRPAIHASMPSSSEMTCKCVLGDILSALSRVLAGYSRLRMSSRRACTSSQLGKGPKQSTRHCASKPEAIAARSSAGGNRASLFAKLM